MWIEFADNVVNLDYIKYICINDVSIGGMTQFWTIWLLGEEEDDHVQRFETKEEAEEAFKNLKRILKVPA